MTIKQAFRIMAANAKANPGLAVFAIAADFTIGAIGALVTVGILKATGVL